MLTLHSYAYAAYTLMLSHRPRARIK
jgi:hypothetical protein